MEITWIAHAFQGIKIAVGILILDAALKMIKKMQKRPLQVGILVAAFVLLMLVNVLKIHVSSILVMLASALVSLAFFQIDKFRRKEGQV